MILHTTVDRTADTPPLSQTTTEENSVKYPQGIQNEFKGSAGNNTGSQGGNSNFGNQNGNRIQLTTHTLGPSSTQAYRKMVSGTENPMG